MSDTISNMQINDLTLKVWSMMLGYSLRPCSPDLQRAGSEPFVLGRVVISGAWQGAVTLGCSNGLARRAAATMFGKEPEETDLGEIRDALGELTNMVGGNFKTLLEGDCKLSVPSVCDAIACAEFKPPPTEHLWFDYEAGVVLVNVVRGSGDNTESAPCR